MLEDGDAMQRRSLALTTALALIVLARSAGAQDSQVELHANYLPNTGSNSSAWEREDNISSRSGASSSRCA
jgi:hypothetical protein